MRSTVAESALDAGATLVNDVSGGLADPSMLPLIAATKAPYVIMHWRGHSTRMDQLTTYGDVVNDVCTELAQRLDNAVCAGVDTEAVILGSRFGIREERQPQLGCCLRTSMPDAAWPSPAHWCVAEEIPGRAARRPGNRAATVDGSARRCDGRHHCACCSGRRLGGPRPRGSGEPRRCSCRRGLASRASREKHDDDDVIIERRRQRDRGQQRAVRSLRVWRPGPHGSAVDRRRPR